VANISIVAYLGYDPFTDPPLKPRGNVTPFVPFYQKNMPRHPWPKDAAKNG